MRTTPETMFLNPFLHPPPNKCRTLLNRFYFSRKIQLFYLFLIGFCIFDLVWSIAKWEDYPNDEWTIIMNLSLNLIILLDSLLRLYMYGCRQFCNCSENWMEILVLIMVCPDVLFLCVYYYFANSLSQELELASLCYGGVIIVLRPIVFCRRQTRAKPQSIYLPSSVLIQDEETSPKKCGPARMDSIEDCMFSFDARRSMEG
jgi:hypothetical protein